MRHKACVLIAFSTAFQYIQMRAPPPRAPCVLHCMHTLLQEEGRAGAATAVSRRRSRITSGGGGLLSRVFAEVGRRSCRGGVAWRWSVAELSKLNRMGMMEVRR
jgi:hypothetical protein